MTDSCPYFQSVGGFLSQKHILDSKYFTDLIKAKWGGICNKCMGFHIEVYRFMNEENPKAIHEYLGAVMGGLRRFDQYSSSGIAKVWWLRAVY